jgi:hypothetical protein
MTSMREHAVLFSGPDLAGSASDLLRREAAQGAALVALDSQAMAWAVREGLPCAFMDGWLDEDDFSRARREAPEFEAAWFAPRREAFTFDGLCWPEFDREVLYAYWLSACTAQVLAEGLARRGVRRLTVFRRDPPRPMLYFEPADTPACIGRRPFRARCGAWSCPPWRRRTIPPPEAVTNGPAISCTATWTCCGIVRRCV